jgi:nitroreductase
VEKGISLEQAKQPFGIELRRRLLQSLNNSNVKSKDPILETRAKLAISALDNWNLAGNRGIGLVTEKVPELNTMKYEEVFESFFSSRKSIRNFSEKQMEQHRVLEAIKMALNSPSVCNRQGWRIWLVQDKEKVREIRQLQNGNLGFTNLNTLLVFGVDRRMFTVGIERNQMWVDGGLFAMSTVWSLHSKGIGSCFLNWAESPKQSKKLRSILKAPICYEFITLCAIGYADENSLSALSAKKSLDEVLDVL